MSLDWPLDNLGFLSEKLGQMLPYIVRSQTHRLISTSLVLIHTKGRALTVASIKPIVTHKPLRILNDWYKFLAYPAVNLCTVLWIKVIMTNNGKHDASFSFNVPISTLFWEDDLCVAFASSSNQRREFRKRSQFFICAHNETLSNNSNHGCSSSS